MTISRTSSPACIWVRFTAEGLHRWPDATTDREYLASPHRHMFHVQVALTVDHDDREIEFHDLRDAAVGIFKGLAPRRFNRLNDFGPQSCEMLARRLATELADRYERDIEVEVSEDQEFGAVVTVGPETET